MGGRHVTRALALVGAMGCSTVTMAENVDPEQEGLHFAYAENVGWINAKPSGAVGPGVQVDDARLTGWMWGENVGWISLSCSNRSTCDAAQYGVGNDGSGVLSGHAWGENAGWISFSCRNRGTCDDVSYGVTIDPFSGRFEGAAWGENIGWILFEPNTAGQFGVRTSWCGSNDNDMDTFTPCDGDCDDSDMSVFPGAPESNDGVDNQCPGDPGHDLIDEVTGSTGFVDSVGEFCWEPQQGATGYEVARAEDAGFSINCSVTSTPGPCISITEAPPAGGVFYLLVRAATPFVGSWGTTSGGLERADVCQ